MSITGRVATETSVKCQLFQLQDFGKAFSVLYHGTDIQHVGEGWCPNDQHVTLWIEFLTDLEINHYNQNTVLESTVLKLVWNPTSVLWLSEVKGTVCI